MAPEAGSGLRTAKPGDAFISAQAVARAGTTHCPNHVVCLHFPPDILPRLMSGAHSLANPGVLRDRYRFLRITSNSPFKLPGTKRTYLPSYLCEQNLFCPVLGHSRKSRKAVLGPTIVSHQVLPLAECRVGLGAWDAVPRWPLQGKIHL